jgi:hypothetical protein
MSETHRSPGRLCGSLLALLGSQVLGRGLLSTQALLLCGRKRKRLLLAQLDRARGLQPLGAGIRLAPCRQLLPDRWCGMAGVNERRRSACGQRSESAAPLLHLLLQHARELRAGVAAELGARNSVARAIVDEQGGHLRA